MLSISSNARLMLAAIPVFNIVFLHNFKVEKRWSASIESCHAIPLCNFVNLKIAQNMVHKQHNKISYLEFQVVGQ